LQRAVYLVMQSAPAIASGMMAGSSSNRHAVTGCFAFAFAFAFALH